MSRIPPKAEPGEVSVINDASLKKLIEFDREKGVNEGSAPEQLLTSQNQHVGQIELSGDETYEVACGVRTVGVISLYRCEGIVLPPTVVRIDRIELEQGQLQLPDSVKEVGYLEIYLSDSSLGHAGVEKFGVVALVQADF